MSRFAQIAFTPRVKSLQSQLGSRNAYARMEGGASAPDVLGDDERAFIAARDSFYLASVSETGWPYVQHRGGPIGFVQVLDAHTIGFADYRGNRQYVSAGNVDAEERVALIFVDYPNRTRLKILARATAALPGSADFARLPITVSRAKVERGFLLRVEGVDWNCPQHITPRFTEAELQVQLAEVSAEMQSLRRENQALKDLLSKGRLR